MSWTCSFARFRFCFLAITEIRLKPTQKNSWLRSIVFAKLIFIIANLKYSCERVVVYTETNKSCIDLVVWHYFLCLMFVLSFWHCHLSKLIFIFYTSNVCMTAFVLIVWMMVLFVFSQYNTKDSSVRLAYEAQPRPRAIASLVGETIVKVACGTNHTGCNISLIHLFCRIILWSCWLYVAYYLWHASNFSFNDISCSG